LKKKEIERKRGLIMYPKINELKEIIINNKNKIILAYEEINGDMETPIGIYQKLCKNIKSYLLESNDGIGKSARYSFIGFNLNELKVDSSKEPLSILRSSIETAKPINTIKELPFCGGYVGYLGYDTIRYYEELPDDNINDLNLPDVKLALAEDLICYDHLLLKIYIIIRHKLIGEPEKDYKVMDGRISDLKDKILNTKLEYNVQKTQSKITINSNTTKEEYMQKVEKAKEYIRCGDIFQVVLSQRLEVEIDAHPFDIYRKLRIVNPSPYMYYIDFGDFQISGSSPEMLVKVKDDVVQTRPIAGTRKRGKSPEEDDILEKELMIDKKELAEHLMLVDLGRNDLGKVSIPGSVRTQDLMHVERFSHVMHIVSDVYGTLDDKHDSIEAIKSCLPAGTLSGAPKIRAMEIIDELETHRRGIYGGAIGYFGYDGNMDTCIVIRTIVFNKGKAYLQAGAGIVYDSVPEKEYEETLNKLGALITTLENMEE
jgi:anthranilate synthase component 1